MRAKSRFFLHRLGRQQPLSSLPSQWLLVSAKRRLISILFRPISYHRVMQSSGFPSTRVLSDRVCPFGVTSLINPVYGVSALISYTSPSLLRSVWSDRSGPVIHRLTFAFDGDLSRWTQHRADIATPCQLRRNLDLYSLSSVLESGSVLKSPTKKMEAVC